MACLFIRTHALRISVSNLNEGICYRKQRTKPRSSCSAPAAAAADDTLLQLFPAKKNTPKKNCNSCCCVVVVFTLKVVLSTLPNQVAYSESVLILPSCREIRNSVVTNYVINSTEWQIERKQITKKKKQRNTNERPKKKRTQGKTKNRQQLLHKKPS